MCQIFRSLMLISGTPKTFPSTANKIFISFLKNAIFSPNCFLHKFKNRFQTSNCSVALTNRKSWLVHYWLHLQKNLAFSLRSIPLGLTFCSIIFWNKSNVVFFLVSWSCGRHWALESGGLESWMWQVDFESLGMFLLSIQAFPHPTDV